MNYKYLCLDIGNVLCHVDFKGFLNTLSEIFNITIEEATYFVAKIQKIQDVGLTSMEQELREHFKVNSPVIIKKLLKEWDNCVFPNLTILDCLDKLIKKYNIQTALLSNIGMDHAKLMRSNVFSKYPLFNNSIKYFSCEVGVRKPSLLYYHGFLLEHPEFKGSFYIDDLQENLDTGSKLGFTTLNFILDEPVLDQKNNIGQLEYFIENLIEQSIYTSMETE